MGRVKFHALISKAEMDLLPWFWAELNFVQGGMPNVEVLESQLLQHPDVGRYIPGIRKLLTNGREKVRNLTLQILLHHLAEWDGIFTDPNRPEEKQELPEVYLKLALDETERLVFRIWNPGGKGSFTYDFRGIKLAAEINASGWSNVLCRTAPGAGPWVIPPEMLFDAWTGRGENQPRIVFNPKKMIRFLPLARHGLVGAGYLETERLQASSAFRLLVAAEEVPGVEMWGRKYCRNLRRIDLSDEMQAAGWHLYGGHDAEFDPEKGELKVKEEIAFSARWFGGLRNVGRAWYAAALPELRVCAPTGKPQATVDGQKMVLSREEGNWFEFRFPEAVEQGQAGKDLTVEVSLGKQQAWKKVIRIVRQLPLPQLPKHTMWGFDAGSLRKEKADPAVSHHHLIGAASSWAAYKGISLQIRGEQRAFSPQGAGDLAAKVLATANKKGISRRTALLEVLQKYVLALGHPMPFAGYLGSCLRYLEAMGWFHFDQGRAQLSPPALVWLPCNQHRNRAIFSGIITLPFWETVAGIIHTQNLPIHAKWKSSHLLLPPTLCLSTTCSIHIEKLAAAIEEKYPGYLQFDNEHEYALSLLNFAEPIEIPEAKPDTIRQTHMPEKGAFFDLKSGGFRDLPFPENEFAIQRRQVEPEGYMRYTWWTKGIGIPCTANAIWPLMRNAGIPLLFQNVDRSDEIFIPTRLRLPALIERGLVMASGQYPQTISQKEIAELPADFPPEFALRRFVGIRFQHREQLSRILYPQSTDSTTQSLFFPIHLNP
ncbi:MAG TPA: hypothetical protein ENJ82_13475 [Bacteroidetes bacterium]|nr:hypothetical protein [Bacteroidota bacterium]